MLCQENQDAVDDLYKDVVVIFEDVDRKLPSYKNGVTVKNRNKKRQPIWNMGLEELWKKVSEAEKCLRKSKDRYVNRRLCRSYKEAQDRFDRGFRREKRKFKREQLLATEEISTQNPNQFWESIKKIGQKKENLYTNGGIK